VAFGRFSIRRGSKAKSITSGGHGGRPDADSLAARERATKLFDLAQEQFRRRRFAKAAELYAAAQAEIERFPECANWVVMFRLRRAFSYYAVERFDEALTIFDQLIAEQEKLKAAGRDGLFNRARFPDEIPSIYWSRALCLEALGRLEDARDAIPGLIEEIGSGATPKQRSYLGDAYLLQAKVAESQGNHEQALKATDAALAHCARYDEPWVAQARHDAEQMQQAIKAARASL